MLVFRAGGWLPPAEVRGGILFPFLLMHWTGLEIWFWVKLQPFVTTLLSQLWFQAEGEYEKCIWDMFFL